MVKVHIEENNPRGYNTFEGFQQVEFSREDMSSEERFRSVINHALANQREKAWDHEAKEHDHNGEKKMFFGAALVRTKENKFYLTANIHLKNSPASRDCAEACGVGEAAQDVGARKLEIEEIWFMGGNGDLSQGAYILPDQYGRRNTPCGSCLDVIFNNRLKNGKETVVHMLPLNDGDWDLLPDDRRAPENLEKHQILSRTIGELFPHVTMMLEDKHGELKKDIGNGWRFLQDKATIVASYRAMQAGEISDLARLEESTNKIEGIKPENISKIMFKVINQTLVEALKKEYMQENPNGLRKATIAIVRCDDGSYRMGTFYDDGETLGTPPAVYNALQNAGRRKVTDVFILRTDFKETPELLAKQEGENAADPVEVKMPDGEVRDRMRKARVMDKNSGVKDIFGQASDPDSGPNVHVFVLNNIKDFRQDRHVITKTSKELGPYAFSSPKFDTRSAAAAF